LNDKKNASAREGSCSLISTLCEQGVGHAVEPIVFEKLFGTLVGETFADKVPVVRQGALDAVRSLVQIMTPWATATILPTLLNEIKTAGKWQVKAGALEILDQLVVSAPEQMARLTPEIVPVLAEAIWDTKADVKKAARVSLTKSTNLVSNKDIERFIPALINALINPVEEVPKTIQLLGATTFVSEVDSPTLSLLVPLLSRGLNERPTSTKRKVAVIIVRFFLHFISLLSMLIRLL
jgi:elongation factor 3